MCYSSPLEASLPMALALGTLIPGESGQCSHSKIQHGGDVPLPVSLQHGPKHPLLLLPAMVMHWSSAKEPHTSAPSLPPPSLL